MTWRSTTFRFAALVFLSQIVAAVVLLAGVSVILQKQSTARSQAVAETVRDELLAAYRKGGTRAVAQEIELRRTQAITRGSVMLLIDAQGRALAGNLATWPPSLTPQGGYTERELYPRGHLAPDRMLVRATRLGDGAQLLTGVVVESERQLLELLEGTVAVALALALVIAATAAWLSARVIVARLDATVETLAAVRAGDLARRVPADRSGDAFAALGGQVNFTLDRVAALIGELQIATDGLAHDLKSPLTRLRVALERVVQAPDEAAVRAEADRAVDEVERLQSLVETALSISRAEAGMGREAFVAVDLADTVRTIAEIYAPLVEDHGRQIRVEAPASLPWTVHQQLIQQSIGNLIDNSINYGAGEIVLTLDVGDDGARIAVCDAGPGIPADQREAALRRFGRLDSARRGGGAGLGLSLAQAVARLHGGALTLGDAAPGLCVTMRLT